MSGQKYDPEFEKYWEKKLQQGEWDMFKPFAAMVWSDLQQPEVKPLELKGGLFNIICNGIIQQCRSVDSFRNVGRERKTREQAEAAAADKMRKRDRLHAFATEFMGKEYEFVRGKNNYSIYFSHERQAWEFLPQAHCEYISDVYMTKECAEYLCAALNDGRLVL